MLNSSGVLVSWAACDISACETLDALSFEYLTRLLNKYAAYPAVNELKELS